MHTRKVEDSHSQNESRSPHGSERSHRFGGFFQVPSAPALLALFGRDSGGKSPVSRVNSIGYATSESGTTEGESPRSASHSRTASRGRDPSHARTPSHARQRSRRVEEAATPGLGTDLSHPLSASASAFPAVSISSHPTQSTGLKVHPPSPSDISREISVGDRSGGERSPINTSSAHGRPPQQLPFSPPSLTGVGSAMAFLKNPKSFFGSLRRGFGMRPCCGMVAGGTPTNHLNRREDTDDTPESPASPVVTLPRASMPDLPPPSFLSCATPTPDPKPKHSHPHPLTFNNQAAYARLRSPEEANDKRPVQTSREMPQLHTPPPQVNMNDSLTSATGARHDDRQLPRQGDEAADTEGGDGEEDGGTQPRPGHRTVVMTEELLRLLEREDASLLRSAPFAPEN